jgi:predicted lipid carrier protein YhbT
LIRVNTRPGGARYASGMNAPESQIPRAPRLAATAAGLLPRLPLQLALNRFAPRIAGRHPGLFRRLGVHAAKTFAIDPTDLPLVFLLTPRPGGAETAAPRVRIARGDAHAAEADARIAGPLAALLGMVHGVYDGDALFFSRDVVFEGDTEAAVALRNAIDDAELDLAAEAADLLGPLGRGAPTVARIVGRATGLALTRPDPAPGYASDPDHWPSDWSAR